MRPQSVLTAPPQAAEQRPPVGDNHSHNRAAPKQFDLAPLLEATGLHHCGLQRATHASGEAIAVAAAHGLTVAQADRWAVRCGLHPAEVWNQWAPA